LLDNAVTLRWLFGDGKASELNYANTVLDLLASSNAVVPVNWGLEVANVIARAKAKQLITEAKSETFLLMLDELSIEVNDATSAHALADTLQLSRRYLLSAYDASYLELALSLSLPLASLDADLMKAAKKAGVKKVV
jgi:predicted nucleic acid-binding protein